METIPFVVIALCAINYILFWASLWIFIEDMAGLGVLE